MRVAPEVAARKARQAAKDAATLDKVPPTDRCPHLDLWDKEPKYGRGCECSDDGKQRAEHHRQLAMARQTNPTIPFVEHYPPPCPYCGGFPRSRIWV